MITFADVKNCPEVRIYIEQADASLKAMGFTEHSLAHVTKVANDAKEILLELGFPEREAELAEIAGYLHDIGNVVNRADHAQSGAIMSFYLLKSLCADAEDIAVIVSAIGNHDEHTAFPVNSVAAALILADKTDVRRSRVRNSDIVSFDIHDRVNFAVEWSEIEIIKDRDEFVLRLQIDNTISAVMDYFEIFLGRMLLCRKAAEKLGLKFRLVINETQLL
jgi:metal-dependent HD superfamily phosphatase/phosphodiesterase